MIEIQIQIDEKKEIAGKFQSKKDLQKYAHDLAGALDRVDALITILESPAELTPEKRSAYAGKLREAEEILKLLAVPKQKLIAEVLSDLDSNS